MPSLYANETSNLMTQLDSKELRRAFGTFITGVTVVTTQTPQGENVGFTANSFTSVSLDPALVLICLSQNMSCYPVFTDCTHFAINVLADTQEDISNLFATYEGDRFAMVEWYPDSNKMPLIKEATSYFSCKKHQLIDAGDHTILIGEITDFSTTGKEGLGYSNRGYFQLPAINQVK